MIDELQKEIGHTFKDQALLRRALTHSSYANERHEAENNERLEFLGDSVLGMITGEFLFLNYAHLPEGELTKLRASLVCEASLVDFARSLSLGEHLLLGRGEIGTGGRARPSILADAFEAVLAAVYLDAGMDAARGFVLRFIRPALEKHREAFKDYKTMLQEIIQKNPEERLQYVPAGESGPDHDKRFVVEVRLNGQVIGKGEGRSKKQAEQDAAREALSLMGVKE